MSRYFIEVSYKGTNYAGFQIQKNANSVQAEVEKALFIFFKVPISLTGSSRTDVGVHASSNYFHFDTTVLSAYNAIQLHKIFYNLNSILPPDIVVISIFPVDNNAHSRFDAKSREYTYYIYQNKDPFYADRAFFYPYNLNFELLHKAAAAILSYNDFTSFSKRNTQVTSFKCDIFKSQWIMDGKTLNYTVVANRFLRGMVKGLVGTMLKVGTGRISIDDFHIIFQKKDCSKADFAVPPQGLFLKRVVY